MITVTTASAVLESVRNWRRRGERVAFVPTMGNLHAGHMSLIDLAKQRAPHVVVSIYVNPLQFGLDEDFYAYPRTIESDTQLLADADVDLLFTPSTKEMYPLGEEGVVVVDVPELSGMLCGRVRPRHFVGVATIVTKLLNIVRPDAAVFGEKDYQQLTIIRRMVADLCVPVEIVGAPTGREADGLAMSSRNRYLTKDERALAPSLYAELRRAEDKLRSGESIERIRQSALGTLSELGFEPDYFEVRSAYDLKPPVEDCAQLVVLAAARLGRARLIDNLQVDLISE